MYRLNVFVNKQIPNFQACWRYWFGLRTSWRRKQCIRTLMICLLAYSKTRQNNSILLSERGKKAAKENNLWCPSLPFNFKNVRFICSSFLLFLFLLHQSLLDPELFMCGREHKAVCGQWIIPVKCCDCQHMPWLIAYAHLSCMKLSIFPCFEELVFHMALKFVNQRDGLFLLTCVYGSSC